METKRTYPVKGVLTVVGKSLLYLLFFLAVQLLAGIVYAALAVAGGADAGSILGGAETAVLLSYLLTAAAILLWFRLRHKPLGEAAGLRRCSGWTAAFCAFAAIGLFVVVQLALMLLPAAWLLAQTGSVNNVWWAFLIAEVVSILMSLAFYARINKTTIAPLYH